MTMVEPGSDHPNRLRARRLGVHTSFEAVVFMRSDCHVCRSEGFDTHARVLLVNGKRSVIATLYHVSDNILQTDDAGLSESAWVALGVANGDPIFVKHSPTLPSLDQVRGKVYGHRLSESALTDIINDVVNRTYSDIQLSSFVTACAARPLDYDEVVALSRAMIKAGEQLTWDTWPIADKHCVGGLPGNRTTPIIVAIAAACGLTMPKTSSRAITSPAGTADTMETMTEVNLDLEKIRKVIATEGGCIAWGGAVRLSPADDTLIRIERALDLDSEGQLVASVLSKKIAAGSTHVVLDIPVGPTAKVRNSDAAEHLSQLLADVANAFGLVVKTIQSDGRQPVGSGIGPALEARDVLSVLQRTVDAPTDLRARSLQLAGALLELTGKADQGGGTLRATEVLDSGGAWAKFQAICRAQGGMREPPHSTHRRPVLVTRGGTVRAIDNRRLARVAKLAGAPDAKAAGVELHARLGVTVDSGDPLFTVHAETPGELSYALDYAAANTDIIELSQ